MINTLILAVCAVLFLIFLTVRRDEILRKKKKQPVGRLNAAWNAAERRQHARHKINLSIPYTLTEEENRPAKSSRARDIARGGIALVVEEKLIPGTRIRLSFNALDKITRSGILAQVMHCKELKPKNGRRCFQLGLRFLDLSDADWKTLLSQVTQTDVARCLFIGLALSLFFASFLADPQSAQAYFGIGGPKTTNRTRERIEQRRAAEKKREEAMKKAYEQELEAYAHEREGRENRLKGAGWLEEAEDHYVNKDFARAYQLYRLLVTSNADRPLREKAKQRIQELEDNQILAKIILEEKKQKAMKGLESKDPVIRLEAVKQLGLLKDPSVLNMLVDSLKDPDPFVRRLAAWSLGQVGNPSGVSALIIALQDESSWTQTEAHAALVHITGQDLGHDANAWSAWWDKQGK